MIKNTKTKYWLIFTIGWYILMFIMVPPKKGPKVSPFGFYLGFCQAVIITWFAVKTRKLWKFPGDILYKGIPILVSLSWIPPAIIFAYYFPYHRELKWKAIYTFTFALGTTISQYIQSIIGMFEGIRWKTIYTLPFSLLAHSIMALSLPLFKLDDIRERSN